MNKTAVKSLQRVLRDAGTYSGKIDGLRGPLTNGAVDALIKARGDDFPEGVEGWSARRRAVACLQRGALDRDIDAGPVDGLWGPQTEFAADALATLFETGEPPPAWRDEPVIDVNPNDWPREAALSEAFGSPCEARLVRVPCPWTLSLAWDLRQTCEHIGCHERVAESLRRVLQRVYEHYGEERLRELRLNRYGGCYNCRRKRGGSSWSTHAWGVAIDWDPDQNKLRWGRDRARLARPEYDAWWRFWEEEGWVSLGRARNFDWMHVQAAKL